MSRIMAVMLAVVLAFGMCSVAFAATNNVKTVLGSTTSGNAIGGKDIFLDSTGQDWDDDSLGETKPETELKLFINPDCLLDSSNQILYGYNGNGVLTESVLRREKITVKRSVSKGGDLLDSVDFSSESVNNNVFGNGKTAYVKVEFVEYFVSTSDKDYDYTVYLALDGTRQRQTEIVIAGTMVNDEDEVYDGDDYCSGEDGTVIKAEEYVRGIEMYLGDGVSAHLNMFKGTKYYGTARNEISSADDAILNQYPSIDTVIVIRQVNLNGSAVKYTFDMDGNYYVYNTDGTYLGTTADELPYSAKYYLSTERLNIADSSSSTPDPVESSEPEPVDPVDPDPQQPNMGGDGDYTYVDNANDNPGTGINGYVSVAIVAGLLALATAGAVSLKK